LQESTNSPQPNHKNHSHKGKGLTATQRKNRVPTARKSQPQKINGLPGAGGSLEEVLM